jgi:hypothetical protein
VRAVAAGVLALMAFGGGVQAGGAGAHAPRDAGKFACDIHNIYFDVVGLDLTERATAHWSFTGEDGQVAQLDTVQTGRVAWHRDHSTKAERRKYRQIMTFQELTGVCRVPNFRQGELSGKAQGMTYHLDGTWSAGAQSGTCTTDETTTRQVSGNFMRLSLSTRPPARKVGVKLVFGGPTALDCPFMAYDAAGDRYVAAHLRSARFGYLPYVTRIAKTTVTAHRIVRLPFHLTSDGFGRSHAAPLWNDGQVQPALTLSGTLTLKRYKDCHIRSLHDILHTSCPTP